MSPIGYNPNHPYAEPNVTPINDPYNPRDNYYGNTTNNDTSMIGTKVKQATKKLSKRKRRKLAKRAHKNKRDLERIRLQAKADSPGVPPNTCPYIDMVLTMINDLQGAYDRLRERGEYNPMINDISQQASDMMEYVRKANETLRDNSGYWYAEYKRLLTRKHK